MNDGSPMFAALFVAIRLIEVHAPDGAVIEINPEEVISMRGPRAEDGGKYFGKDAHCMINTSDGKFVTVKETCKEILELISGGK